MNKDKREDLGIYYSRHSEGESTIVNGVEFGSVNVSLTTKAPVGSISKDKDLVNYDGRKSSVVTYRTDKQ